jgi:hypothetical protein
LIYIKKRKSDAELRCIGLVSFSMPSLLQLLVRRVAGGILILLKVEGCSREYGLSIIVPEPTRMRRKSLVPLVTALAAAANARAREAAGTGSTVAR